MMLKFCILHKQTNCNLPRVAADNGAPGWCVIRGSWVQPGNVFAQENHYPASVGRGLDSADPVSVLDWYVEWYHFQNYYREMPPKPIFDSIFPTWQVS